MDEKDPVIPMTGDANRPNDVAVVNLLLNQLTHLEQRLGQKIDGNAADGRSRWQQHETDHADQVRALERVEKRLDEHLRAEEREDLVMQARIDPARRAFAFLIREWRTIAILVLLVLDLIGTIDGRIWHGLFGGQQ